jgi:alkyl hydroperoxide reductase subunit AhpC
LSRKIPILTSPQSADDLSSHSKWVSDINEVNNTTLKFPIIADADRNVAWLYDMISQQDIDRLAKEGGIAFTIRSVFVIDPAKKIRLSDSKGVVTPIDWQKGEDVIVPPSVSTADAKKKFGEENVRELKPYLRFAKV